MSHYADSTKSGPSRQVTCADIARGDLRLHMARASALKGTWLVLDFWSGYAGLCLALLSLGVHFYALAAEQDPEAAKCASGVMPSIVHCNDIHAITVP